MRRLFTFRVQSFAMIAERQTASTLKCRLYFFKRSGVQMVALSMNVFQVIPPIVLTVVVLMIYFMMLLEANAFRDHNGLMYEKPGVYVLALALPSNANTESNISPQVKRARDGLSVRPTNNASFSIDNYSALSDEPAKYCRIPARIVAAPHYLSSMLYIE